MKDRRLQTEVVQNQPSVLPTVVKMDIKTRSKCDSSVPRNNFETIRICWTVTRTKNMKDNSHGQNHQMDFETNKRIVLDHKMMKSKTS